MTTVVPTRQTLRDDAIQGHRKRTQELNVKYMNYIHSLLQQKALIQSQFQDALFSTLNEIDSMQLEPNMDNNNNHNINNTKIAPIEINDDDDNNDDIDLNNNINNNNSNYINLIGDNNDDNHGMGLKLIKKPTKSKEIDKKISHKQLSMDVSKMPDIKVPTMGPMPLITNPSSSITSSSNSSSSLHSNISHNNLNSMSSCHSHSSFSHHSHHSHSHHSHNSQHSHSVHSHQSHHSSSNHSHHQMPLIPNIPTLPSSQAPTMSINGGNHPFGSNNGTSSTQPSLTKPILSPSSNPSSMTKLPTCLPFPPMMSGSPSVSHSNHHQNGHNNNNHHGHGPSVSVPFGTCIILGVFDKDGRFWLRLLANGDVAGPEQETAATDTDTDGPCP